MEVANIALLIKCILKEIDSIKFDGLFYLTNKTLVKRDVINMKVDRLKNYHIKKYPETPKIFIKLN